MINHTRMCSTDANMDGTSHRCVATHSCGEGQQDPLADCTDTDIDLTGSHSSSLASRQARAVTLQDAKSFPLMPMIEFWCF